MCKVNLLLTSLALCCGVLEARSNVCKPAPEMVAGYNAPAWAMKDQNWNGFVGASFIYWLASEDGLSVGRRIPADRSGTAPTLNEKILLQDFTYKPGFKVFAGFGSSSFDNWKFGAEWARLHQTTHSHYVFDGVNDAILLESWVHLLNPLAFATQANSSWKLHLDLLDFVVMRPCFLGKRVTIAPLFGLRTAWIDQDFSVLYQFASITPMEGKFRSDSWGLGPLVALIGNWELGSGFAILSKMYGSFLYTSYTTLSLFETIHDTDFAATSVNADYGPYRTVRPNAGIGLGFSWGHDFCNDRYRFDFSATYDFNVFWNQNMLRSISDNYSFGGSEGAIGSLNLHGLTATTSFSF